MSEMCENCNQPVAEHTIEHLGHVIHVHLTPRCDMFFYIDGRQQAWR